MAATGAKTGPTGTTRTGSRHLVVRLTSDQGRDQSQAQGLVVTRTEGSGFPPVSPSAAPSPFTLPADVPREP